MPDPFLSIIIPILNESESIAAVCEEVCRVLDNHSIGRFEIIVVDDGSTDSSFGIVKQLSFDNPRVKGLRLRSNAGQTLATLVGMRYAAGDIIVTMDGDGQNDAADIPQLVSALGNGVDLVHGWRSRRKDPWLSKVLPSRIANAWISWQLGITVRDTGCALRAMRNDLIGQFNLADGDHRFLPVIAISNGARCLEVPVNHRKRIGGQTHYSLQRCWHVIRRVRELKYWANQFGVQQSARPDDVRTVHDLQRILLQISESEAVGLSAHLVESARYTANLEVNRLGNSTTFNGD